MKRLIIINILLIIALNILPKEKVVEAKEEIVVEHTISSRSLEEPRKQNSTENDNKISKPTEISQEGIDFIKQYEGCITVATTLTGEKYMTIGYRTLW